MESTLIKSDGSVKKIKAKPTEKQGATQAEKDKGVRERHAARIKKLQQKTVGDKSAGKS